MPCILYAMEAASNHAASSPRKFAHILHFKCPKCGKRIRTVRSNENMSREHIARLIFQPTCACGWSGSMAGFTAVQHSVECWVEERFAGSTLPDSVEFP
jgi:predicted RNA-binding Zn-ribbon protein involved in translation (DUF1610 family)